MHPNPAFRGVATPRNIAFARERGFGVLAVNGDGGPLISHVPFLLDAQGRVAELHLVRSNPIVRAAEAPLAAVIAVSGPDGYVSPDWYGVADQVPTWNYVAVHLRGVLERRPQDELRGVLDRLTAEKERRIARKPSWHAGKMTPEVLNRMMRQIVPFRLQVERIDGTWKLNQNKPDDVRLRAAEAVSANESSSGPPGLAGLMRHLPE